LPWVRSAKKEEDTDMQMMNESRGPFMMVLMGEGWLLGLGLIGSLIVLAWTAVGRLRRTSAKA
jgi:hypothetical protein